MFGYLHFITEILSHTRTGLVLAGECRIFMKHGNPGKLPQEALYDLTSVYSGKDFNPLFFEYFYFQLIKNKKKATN